MAVNRNDRVRALVRLFTWAAVIGAMAAVLAVVLGVEGIIPGAAAAAFASGAGCLLLAGLVNRRRGVVLLTIKQSTAAITVETNYARLATHPRGVGRRVLRATTAMLAIVVGVTLMALGFGVGVWGIGFAARLTGLVLFTGGLAVLFVACRGVARGWSAVRGEVVPETTTPDGPSALIHRWRTIARANTAASIVAAIAVPFISWPWSAVLLIVLLVGVVTSWKEYLRARARAKP